MNTVTINTIITIMIISTTDKTDDKTRATLCGVVDNTPGNEIFLW